MLANISQFEALQNGANQSQSSMSVFNAISNSDLKTIKDQSYQMMSELATFIDKVKDQGPSDKIVQSLQNAYDALNMFSSNVEAEWREQGGEGGSY